MSGPPAGLVRRYGACRRCKARIRELATTDGTVAVDPEPDPARGDVVILGQVAVVLPPAKAAAARAGGVVAFARHAATCPHGNGR